MKKIKNLLLIALFASATALAGCSAADIAGPQAPETPPTLTACLNPETSNPTLKKVEP